MGFDMIETWKTIKGFEGLYEVSNTGKVRSIDRVIITKNGVKKTIKGKELFFTISKIDEKSHCPRASVQLWKNNQAFLKKVHRLVAEAFIPNPENKRDVNHINGNKHDNRVENLEWLTHSENMKHAYKIGLNRISEKQSEAIKKANTKYKKGKPLSEEHKKKLGEALARRNKDKEWRKIHYANKSNKI